MAEIANYLGSVRRISCLLGRLEVTSRFRSRCAGVIMVVAAALVIAFMALVNEGNRSYRERCVVDFGRS